MDFKGIPPKMQFKIYEKVFNRLEEIEQTEKFEPMTQLIRVIEEETQKCEIKEDEDFMGIIYPFRICNECGGTSFRLDEEDF